MQSTVYIAQNSIRSYPPKVPNTGTWDQLTYTMSWRKNFKQKKLCQQTYQRKNSKQYSSAIFVTIKVMRKARPATLRNPSALLQQGENGQHWRGWWRHYDVYLDSISCSALLCSQLAELWNIAHSQPLVVHFSHLHFQLLLLKLCTAHNIPLPYLICCSLNSSFCFSISSLSCCSVGR